MKLVVDSSALLAIIFDEPEASLFLEAIHDHDPVISAATYVEMSSVLDPRGGSALLDRFLADGLISILDFDLVQAKIARQANREYGRSSGSKAKLNFGDTFSYALAISLKAPLLFKGADFAQTDVRTL